MVCVVLLTMMTSACSLPFVGGGGGSYTLTAYFPRAVSVFKSSDVRVLGLPAGTVGDVEVEGNLVRVDLDIPDDIPVPKDVTAQIVPQSLIGERYVQLSPAFKDGMERATDGMEITKVIVPTEPDEALAALKEFLDSLDPKGIGRLVTNLEEDLRGNGAALNVAIDTFSEVVTTFAEKDDSLARIVDSFDRLTRTLATREQQLGQVLDAFAEASQVLADERASIEGLVAGLADLSREGLSLVAEHDEQLRTDIQTLTDAAAIIDANLSSVSQLLDAGGLLGKGLIGAFNPASRSVNLRNNFSPLIPELIELLLGQLGVPALCLPVMATCGVAGTEAGEAVPARISPSTPIGSLLDLLEAPGAREDEDDGPGLLERAGGWVQDGARTLLGMGS
ncbi:MAG TPA: MlaD family protein [Acidimicrobiales bacterium]|nr:MlaD family protein [Acidimicrobiales bacterium]